MSDTIKLMEFRAVDELYPDQLEVNDTILVGDEFVTIVNIAYTNNDEYMITYSDEYGELDMITVSDDSKINLYMLFE